jgi:hypothetical protein
MFEKSDRSADHGELCIAQVERREELYYLRLASRSQG